MIDFSKYINLKFKHGGRRFDGVDCYGLVCLIYKEERGIDLPLYDYTFRWQEEGYNHIQDNMKDLINWQVSNEPSNILDLILFYASSSSKLVNHIGCYIGDDKFIHVSYMYNSRIDRLNDYWKGRLYKVMRCQVG